MAQELGARVGVEATVGCLELTFQETCVRRRDDDPNLLASMEIVDGNEIEIFLVHRERRAERRPCLIRVRPMNTTDPAFSSVQLIACQRVYWRLFRQVEQRPRLICISVKIHVVAHVFQHVLVPQNCFKLFNLGMRTLSLLLAELYTGGFKEVQSVTFVARSNVPFRCGLAVKLNPSRRLVEVLNWNSDD